MELIIFTFLGFFLWFYYKRMNNDEDFMRSQRILFEKPLPLIGNFLPILLQQEGIIQMLKRLCSKYQNEKIVAVFGFMKKPTLIIKDSAFVKKILITDFDSFQNHDDKYDVSADKFFGRSIFMLRGSEWKDVRRVFSPVFTASKLKFMFELLVECQEDFIKVLVEEAESRGGVIEIDTRKTFERLTVDGISTTVLGMKGDCVKNPNSKLYEIADSMNKDVASFSTTIYMVLPKLYKFLNLQLFRKSTQDFFETFITSELRRRKTENISRPDAIQLMLNLKEGKLKLEAGDSQEFDYNESKIKRLGTSIDDNVCVAQAIGFFLAGFDTNTTLMQVMSYELAINDDIQQTLIQEVDEMLEKLDGEKISYEQLNKMKFLEMVTKESLRKWPPSRVAPRICTKDYLLVDDETGRTYDIRKGTDVMIPIHEIHRNPKYYENPEKFDPYRFDGKSNDSIFLPFGMGPRICTGYRFAMLEAKLIWFYILSKFSIEVSENTPKNLEIPLSIGGFHQKINVSFKLGSQIA